MGAIPLCKNCHPPCKKYFLEQKNVEKKNAEKKKFFFEYYITELEYFINK